VRALLIRRDQRHSSSVFTMRVGLCATALFALLCVLLTVSTQAAEAEQQQLVSNSLSTLRRGARRSSSIVVEDGADSFVEEASSRKKRPQSEPGRTAKCRGGGCGRKGGWGVNPIPPRRVRQHLPAPRLSGAAATLTRANVRCVLCQFVAQKLKNGLIGAPPGTASVDPNAAAAAPAAVDPNAAAAAPVDPNAVPVALLETASFASAADQARIEALVSADATAAAEASALPSLFENGPDNMRRFRHTDLFAHRPSRARFSQIPTVPSAAQRDAYLRLYSTVYAQFEDLCAKKMPLAYLPYCNDMLKSYRFFAQGINYGDRPDQICMSGNFCDHRAYVRQVVHNLYQREPGDA